MPLSVLSRSRGKNSSPFIETNSRGTNSSFARNFTNLHLRKKPLDLKLTLSINIFLADMQLLWKKGREYGNAVIPTIAPRSQNSDLGRFQQRLVVHRRICYRPQRTMEVHALLPGRKWLRVGSCCCPNRRLRDLARLSPKQHSSRMSRKSIRGVSARSSRFWLGT